MRYRRAQFVMGYHSPCLYYREINNKSLQAYRIPSIQEFITRPINKADVDSLRKMDLSGFEWIPKSLVPHFDEQTGRCLSKRDMINVRFERVN